MIEIWRGVLNHESSYEVSNFGRVRSKDRIIIDKNGREMKYKGQLITPGSRNGYLILRAPKTTSVHRLVAHVFCRKEEGKDCVDHIDFNKTNNNSYNLRWVTNAENNKHSQARRTEGLRKGRPCEA